MPPASHGPLGRPKPGMIAGSAPATVPRPKETAHDDGSAAPPRPPRDPRPHVRPARDRADAHARVPAGAGQPVAPLRPAQPRARGPGPGVRSPVRRGRGRHLPAAPGRGGPDAGERRHLARRARVHDPVARGSHLARRHPGHVGRPRRHLAGHHGSRPTHPHPHRLARHRLDRHARRAHRRRDLHGDQRRLPRRRLVRRGVPPAESPAGGHRPGELAVPPHAGGERGLPPRRVAGRLLPALRAERRLLGRRGPLRLGRDPHRSRQRGPAHRPEPRRGRPGAAGRPHRVALPRHTAERTDGPRCPPSPTGSCGSTTRIPPSPTCGCAGRCSTPSTAS
jgi:hypothetical protein